jgi:hypothetical protein
VIVAYRQLAVVCGFLIEGGFYGRCIIMQVQQANIQPSYFLISVYQVDLVEAILVL